MTARLARSDLPHWLIWPCLYCLYALTRGQISGRYPYPFLDVAALGWPMVALNIAGLVMVFAMLGLIRLARRARVTLRNACPIFWCMSRCRC